MPTVRVAAGVLQREDGRVLINCRPAGKAWAGWWEFPGGKQCRGETVGEALARELHEELGIAVRESEPLVRIRHRYADRRIDMSVHRVTRWDGEVRAREGQPLAWVEPLDLRDYRLLPADSPVVTALRLPRQIAVSPAGADLGELRERLARLPAGVALRLRLPGVDDARYAEAAEELRRAQPGLPLIVDRALTRPDGVFARMWPRGAAIAAVGRVLAGVSVHSALELERAQAQGADFVVLGPVRETPTHPGGRALGWAAAEALVREARVPVYLIGGLGPADLPRAIGIGAQGVAGIRAYWGDDGPPRSSSGASAGIA